MLPTKMKLENVINGINDSPLDPIVKELAIKKVEENSTVLQKEFDKAYYKAPELDYAVNVTTYIIQLIAPLFKEHNVAEPNGRDCMRKVYKNLGGTKEVKYDVCGC